MIDIYNKIKLFYRTKKAIKALDSQISFISGRLKYPLDQKDDFEDLMSLNLFCNLYERDFLISRKLVLTSNKKELDYHLRQLALLCFEYMERIQHILSINLLPAFSKYNLDESVVSSYKATNKALGKIRNKHSQYLKDIRNNCAAHRNFDAMLQVGIIDNLDKDRIMLLAMELSEFQTMLFNMWSIIIYKKLNYDLDRLKNA